MNFGRLKMTISGLVRQPRLGVLIGAGVAASFAALLLWKKNVQEAADENEIFYNFKSNSNENQHDDFTDWQEILPVIRPREPEPGKETESLQCIEDETFSLYDELLVFPAGDEQPVEPHFQEPENKPNEESEETPVTTTITVQVEQIPCENVASTPGLDDMCPLVIDLAEKTEVEVKSQELVEVKVQEKQIPELVVKQEAVVIELQTFEPPTADSEDEQEMFGLLAVERNIEEDQMEGDLDDLQFESSESSDEDQDMVSEDEGPGIEDLLLLAQIPSEEELARDEGKLDNEKLVQFEEDQADSEKMNTSTGISSDSGKSLESPATVGSKSQGTNGSLDSAKFLAGLRMTENTRVQPGLLHMSRDLRYQSSDFDSYLQYSDWSNGDNYFPAYPDQDNSCLSPVSFSDTSSLFEYYFEFPSELCGLLIGFRGRKVAVLEAQTKTSIMLLDRTPEPGMKMIKVEGPQEGIDMLLRILKHKFPAHRFHVTFEPTLPNKYIWFPKISKLSLPVGVTCNVSVTSVTSATRFHLQIQNEASLVALPLMAVKMNEVYTTKDMPMLVIAPEVGMVCAAFVHHNWLRCKVVYVHNSGRKVDLQVMDYGGVTTCHVSNLRVLSEEFHQLPYQAIMCEMANIKPAPGLYQIGRLAKEYLSSEVKDENLHAYTVCSNDYNLPYVYLYKPIPGQPCQSQCINFCMYELGLVQWLE